jgi:glycerophosphoryl diester phosphodiesterase
LTSFPKWQLHRGYWQEGIRENTLAAFVEAKNIGAKMIELDVQLSKEKVVHVFHDFDLKKFFHVDQKVNRVSSDDLEALNVPTLQSVLESHSIPRYINIEIKSIDFWARALPLEVCRLVSEAEKESEVLLSSFNPMCLYWARKVLPQVPRALIIGQREPLFDWKFSWSMRLAAPHFINAHYKLIDAEDSRNYLQSFSRPIMVWTVNDVDKAKFYLKRGASSIISDLPPPV